MLRYTATDKMWSTYRSRQEDYEEWHQNEDEHRKEDSYKIEDTLMFARIRFRFRQMLEGERNKGEHKCGRLSFETSRRSGPAGRAEFQISSVKGDGLIVQSESIDSA